jgi:hypothetical protein
MAPLEGTQTNSDLKRTFSDEGQYDALLLNFEQSVDTGRSHALRMQRLVEKDEIKT